MPTVTRRTETEDRPAGYVVETHTAGATYTYVLDEVSEDELEVVERRKMEDGITEQLDPEATGSVEDEMEELGYEIV